jgi:citrate synthase
MLGLMTRHEEDPMPGARKGGRRAADGDTGPGKQANGIDAAADALPRLRPGEAVGQEVARGLKGVIVAETEIGDVRGLEGFYHYRQYSAVELAEKRSLEDVWYLLFEGRLPNASERRALAGEIAPLRALPASVTALLPALAEGDTFVPLNALRTAVSHLAATAGFRPSLDVDRDTLRANAMQVCAAVPTIVTALHRLHAGLEPIEPRTDLGYAANYLWMMTGEVPEPAHARAIEQYLLLTIDHGFNASTFAARVITSTGADLGAAVVGAIGALSGPLHGGAPSRALDTLDAIGSPAKADAWVRPRIAAGERIMGFGHAVYRTDDPRAVMLRSVAQQLGGPLVDFAVQVEQTIVDTLAELKPGRQLHSNVEYYAGVVMELCGLPREMFTPTFACSRVIGWCANILEQAADNRIIRPSARYVGPPPPQPVPVLSSPS